MEKSTQSEQIVLLLDSDTRDGENLYASLVKAGFPVKAAVIHDDGFLPDDFISVYGSFLGDFAARSDRSGKPCYFNQITVPPYWEISGTSSRGSIHNLSHERGRIFYAEPRHKRLVRVVDWLDERGKVRVSDHYNRYGALYARTIFGTREEKINKTYFDVDGREVIVENYVTGDIILDDGQVRIFHTKTDFVRYFLEKNRLAESRLFFNSLSTPFFVSQRLSARTRGDVLFWQEMTHDAIPGNMQVILQGEATRTTKVMVQKRDSYDKLIALGADASLVAPLGYIYPFRKENTHTPEALICTNSDRLEQCEKIVQALPELHFHIAALTEMSSKLMQMEHYANVSLYPGAKTSVIDELFAKCDYYLDINYENEIVSAVYTAFLHNELIFAIRETMHNADFVPEEHRYAASSVDAMIDDLKRALSDEAELDRMLEVQKTFAMTADETAYQEKLTVI